MAFIVLLLGSPPDPVIFQEIISGLLSIALPFETLPTFSYSGGHGEKLLVEA